MIVGLAWRREVWPSVWHQRSASDTGPDSPMGLGRAAWRPDSPRQFGRRWPKKTRRLTARHTLTSLSVDG